MKIEITPAALILLAFGAVLIPMPWLISWIAAALLHEIGHLIGILLFGGTVRSIRIGATGTVISTRLPTNASEAFCAGAGPVLGLVPLLFARFVPRLAICALFHSLFNLLPMLPLDGGRVYSCLLKRLCPLSEPQCLAWTRRVVLLGILIVSVYLSVKWSFGIMPLLFALWVMIRTGKIKFPCKDGQLRVQ